MTTFSISEELSPEARRAHLILHGQTLLDEWTERCHAYAEVRKLDAEARKLLDETYKPRVETYKLRVETYKLRIETYKLRVEAYNLWREAAALNSKANKLWNEAVAKEGCTMLWDTGCALSNGERYERYDTRSSPCTPRAAWPDVAG